MASHPDGDSPLRCPNEMGPGQASERRAPSSVSTTDLALPTGFRIIPFAWNRASASQSKPFQARHFACNVGQSGARTEGSILFSFISILEANAMRAGSPIGVRARDGQRARASLQTAHCASRILPRPTGWR